MNNLRLRILAFVLVMATGMAAKPPRKSLVDMSLGVWIPQARSLHGKTVLRTLRGFGIPHRVSGDMGDLGAYPAVLAVGPLREHEIDKRQIRRLYRYVEEGGRILFAGEICRSLYHLVDADTVIPKRTRFRMTLRDSARDPVLCYANQPEEMTWRLGDSSLYKHTIWTFGVGSSQHRALALFDDGSPALIVGNYDLGRVYYLGVGWDNVILLPQVGEDFEAQKYWVNHFEPTTDMFMLLIKAFYRSAASPAISLGFAPGEARTALLLSHDVDARESFRNAVEYAKAEKRLDVNSTFFVTTKNFSDETDTAYFNATRIPYVKALDSMGFHVASHSVSHTKIFESLPVGESPAEVSDYNPLQRKTLWGEVQVSKWLLEKCGIEVNAFRSGELAYHQKQVDILERCGYTINSTFSANDVMCNFPFRPLRARNVAAPESGLLEIPVTFDGSMGYLTPKNREEMVSRWTRIVRCNMENGAISTLLIHPNVTAHKLRAVTELVGRVRSPDVWIGDLDAYADFYNQSRKVGVLNAGVENGELTIRLTVPHEEIPASFNVYIGNTEGVELVRLRDRKNTRLVFRANGEGRWLRLFAVGRDQEYYRFQRRLVAVIAGLFGALILSLALFFLIQRGVLLVELLRSRPDKSGIEVDEILCTDEPVAEKAACLRKLGHRRRVRAILLEQMDFVKGRASEELTQIYRGLGFAHGDMRELVSRRWWERAEGARSMGRLLIRESIPALVSLLNDRNGEVRLAAAFALARFEDRRVVPFLIDTIKRSDLWTAEILTEYLVPLRGEAARALVQLLAEEQLAEEVRAIALEVLGDLQALDAVPYLVGALKSGRRGITVAALHALGKIGDDTVIEEVGAVLRESGDDEVFAAALECLGSIGAASAVVPLLEALARSSGHRALGALRALGRLGDEGNRELMRIVREGQGETSVMALQVLEESGYFDRQIAAVVDQEDKPTGEARAFLETLVRIGHTKRLEDYAAREESGTLTAVLKAGPG